VSGTGQFESRHRAEDEPHVHPLRGFLAEDDSQEGVQHARMGDDQDGAFRGRFLPDSREGARRARDQPFEGLPAGRRIARRACPAVELESRVAFDDLRPRQPLPGSEVHLAQVGVEAKGDAGVLGEDDLGGLGAAVEIAGDGAVQDRLAQLRRQKERLAAAVRIERDVGLALKAQIRVPGGATMPGTDQLHGSYLGGTGGLSGEPFSVAEDDGNGRLAVRKMYKLYVGGQFIRSESGRSDPAGSANVARASRKDLRDAVVAARGGHGAWYGLTPALRGQILYRLTEMMEGRSAELAARLEEGGLRPDAARREVELAIDRALWYAGWCDKYAAVLSARNPVGGPHFNFSTPEPMGVVGVAAPDRPSLLGLVTSVLPPLVSGNGVVAIASEADPRTAIVFAECVATSDMPAGALNILTGKRADLLPHLARHMDVNAVAVYNAEARTAADVVRMASENLKRVDCESADEAEWGTSRFHDLERVARFVEIKTIWHPAAI
jgi:hypothetical protein